MKKYLLIAEKPSLKRELQATYTAHPEVFEKLDIQIDFTNLAGHACRLQQPKEYEAWAEKKWKEIELPMIPEPWVVKSIDSMNDTLKSIEKMIKENNYDGLIAAEDPEREGNLIQHLVEKYLNLEDMHTLRIWLNEGLTDDKILKAYQSMVDFHEDPFQQRLTAASLLRAKEDWLLGMNLTMAVTVRAGKLINVGKVKSPVQTIVYKNTMAVRNYKESVAYEVNANATDFSATAVETVEEKLSSISFSEKAEAEKFSSGFATPGKAKVTSVKSETKNTYPDKLFNLGGAQGAAGSTFGIDPDVTLSTLQELYEKKILSYPRTGSPYLSTSIFAEIKKSLAVCSIFEDLKPLVDNISEEDFRRVENNTKYVNDKEVQKEAHTAVIPTGTEFVISDLTENQKNILYMVCKQLVFIFLKPTVEKKSTVILDFENTTFKATGKEIIDPGFAVAAGKKLEESKLPELAENQEVEIQSMSLAEKKSSPPTKLTFSSLISEMENAQKYISDKSKKEIMKEAKGIGTPATAANIVKALIENGFINQIKGKGKEAFLEISEIGQQAVETLKGFEFMDPGFVADFEEDLKKVETGEMTEQECYDSFVEFVKTQLPKIAAMECTIKADSNDSEYNCPVCKKPLHEFAWGLGCTGRKDGCQFSLGFEQFGKKLNKKQIDKLLKLEQTEEIKGLKSKEGKEFAAKFELSEAKGYKINLVFEKKKK